MYELTHDAWQSAYCCVSPAVPLPCGHFASHSDVAFACDCDGQGTPTHFAWQQTSAEPPVYIDLSTCLSTVVLVSNLHDCRHLTCGLNDAEVEAALVEATVLFVPAVVATMSDLLVEAVVVAFCAAAKAISPKVVNAVKKRMLASLGLRKYRMQLALVWEKGRYRAEVAV